jgi:uncharacterized protein YmfQ (DUF2313 family)
VTRAPAYGAADFLAAAQDLLPRGYAWPRDPDATLTHYWQAIADRMAVLHGRALDLLETEGDPALTSEALFDWERAFGLPDECSLPPYTVASRRAALLARMAAIGGQSRAYYIAFAAALGFTITITEFRPFRVGVSRVGDPLYGESWLYAWQINAPAVTIIPFRVGISAVGEPLRAWGNEQLLCELRRIAPAHTVLIVAYS